MFKRCFLLHILRFPTLEQDLHSAGCPQLYVEIDLLRFRSCLLIHEVDVLTFCMLTARSIPFPVNALVRQISYSLPRAAKKSATSRVRKKRQDLPESLLSPSGEPIGPLAAWEGGLKGASKKCESFSKAGKQRTLTHNF
jgi:hypothetical protein